MDVNEAVKELQYIMHPQDKESKAAQEIPVPIDVEEGYISALPQGAQRGNLFEESMREAIPKIPKRKRRIVVRRKKRPRMEDVAPGALSDSKRTVASVIPPASNSSNAVNSHEGK